MQGLEWIVLHSLFVSPPPPGQVSGPLIPKNNAWIFSNPWKNPPSSKSQKYKKILP